MKLKLLPYFDFIKSEYNSGKSVQKIADENNWYAQAVTNLLKSENLYKTTKPNQGNIRYFEKCNSKLKAYFLGFITADGCIQSNGLNSYGLTITIHEKDISILHKLKEEIQCENQVKLISGGMTHDKTKIKTHCRFQLFNKELVSDLKSYGLTEKKSTTMPNIIVNIPVEYRKAFILGYFDGDGSISFNKSSNQFFVNFRGTEQFLQGIQDEFNFAKCSIYKDKQRNCYSLITWRKQDISSFFKIYNECEFYLQRKYEKFPEYLKIAKDQTISPS